MAINVAYIGSVNKLYTHLNTFHVRLFTKLGRITVALLSVIFCENTILCFASTIRSNFEKTNKKEIHWFVYTFLTLLCESMFAFFCAVWFYILHTLCFYILYALCSYILYSLFLIIFRAICELIQQCILCCMDFYLKYSRPS